MKTTLKQYRAEVSKDTFVQFAFAHDLNEAGELLLSKAETQALMERLDSYYAPRAVRLDKSLSLSLVELWGGGDAWASCAITGPMERLASAMRHAVSVVAAKEGEERTTREVSDALLAKIKDASIKRLVKDGTAYEWSSDHVSRLANLPSVPEKDKDGMSIPYDESHWKRIAAFLLWAPPAKKESKTKIAEEMPEF
jgi:hypothetical protein